MIRRALSICFALAAIATAQAPRIASLSPPDGSLAVDPGLDELRVRFDRNMDPTVTAVLGRSAAPPPVLEADWDDPRTLWLRVALQPDSVYSLELASGLHGGARARGIGLAADHSWRFATATLRAEDRDVITARNERCRQRLCAVLREHYAHRDRLGVDWDDRVQSFQGRILTAPAGAALCLLLADLLEVSQDPHVAVRWQEATLPAFTRQFHPNYELGLLPASLASVRKINDIALTGRTADGIGYLMLSTFAADRRREVEEAIDAMRELRGLKALVLDVRANPGGDETLARQFAAWFVRGSRTFALQRTCEPRASGGFRTPERRTITGNGPPDCFDGPVAVLTSRANMDACESFLLMMRQNERVALVGEHTWGSCGGAVPHELIPGLHVLLPASQLLRPDGSPVEGQGIAPDLEVRWLEGSGRDTVLDQALAALRAR